MNFFLVIVTTLLSLSSQAQTMGYLDDIRLRKDIDFKDNEENLIKAIDYLMNAPLQERTVSAISCRKFIFKYADKTPYISITLGGALMAIIDDDIKILQLYFGLWCRSAIKRPKKTENEHRKFAFINIAKYCDTKEGVNKTKPIRTLIQAYDEGEIDEWIKAND